MMRTDTKEQRERMERLEGLRVRLGTPGGHPRHAGKDGEAQRKKGERRERERDRERREGTERQAKSQAQGVSERKSREVETEGVVMEFSWDDFM